MDKHHYGWTTSTGDTYMYIWICIHIENDLCTQYVCLNIFALGKVMYVYKYIYIHVQSLGVESVDSTVMQRPPRSRTEDMITKPLIMRVLTSGVLILIGMYGFKYICIFI
jgi:magnesium-transporting ATPase (P-type)